MEFKIEGGRLFFMPLLIAALQVYLGIRLYFHPYSTHSIWDRYLFLGWWFMAFASIHQRRQELKAYFFNKSVLIIDEEFIYDFLNDVKYYWKDIHEIVVDTTKIFPKLEIELKNPDSYLAGIGTRSYRKHKERQLKKGRKLNPFVINLDYVKGNLDDMSEVLQSYWDLAEGREKAGAPVFKFNN